LNEKAAPPMRLERYEPRLRSQWDAFVARAKNGVFLFDRGYVEYHADRFDDHSLLCFEEDVLVGVMPASERDGVFTSHGGLTFGGFVVDERVRTAQMLRMFGALVGHLRSSGIRKLVYKAVPHIYHRIPAEEDLYALAIHGARLSRRDVAATLYMADRPPYTKGRKWAVNKAKKSALEIRRSERFAEFMRVEEENLSARHGVKPVHTAEEIALLAGRFPENIKLFEASAGGDLLAGIIVYESAAVAHAQYIASTPQGRDVCALDAVIDHLLTGEYASKRFFDFGISTEDAGRRLNAGLMDNKESYGARAVVYDFYELELA
jgi:hypothetical protein